MYSLSEPIDVEGKTMGMQERRKFATVVAKHVGIWGSLEEGMGKEQR